MSESKNRVCTRIGRSGRIVIPAEMRRELGIKEGDVLTLQVDDGVLRIYSALEGLRRAREIARRHIPPGSNVLDEFIAERRAEAEDE